MVKAWCWRSVGTSQQKVLEAVENVLEQVLEKVLEVIGESVGASLNTRRRGGVAWRSVTR